MTGDLPNLPIPAPDIKPPELLTDSSGPGIYSAHPNIVFQDGASTRFADAPAIVFANSGREARESSTPPASRRWRGTEDSSRERSTPTWESSSSWPKAGTCTAWVGR